MATRRRPSSPTRPGTRPRSPSRSATPSASASQWVASGSATSRRHGAGTARGSELPETGRLWAGVKIGGGCCGTTPEHIKLIRSEARSLQPAHRKLAVTVEEPKAKAQALPKIAVAQKSELGAKLAAGKFVAFVEILPPRGV